MKRRHATKLPVAIFTAAACSLACGVQRAELPLPQNPLTPTPDAPFRSRIVVPVEPVLPELRINRGTLDNGMTVVHVEAPESRRVATLYVNRRGGSMTSEYDAALAELTLSSLLRGGTVLRDGRVLSGLRVNGEPIRANVSPDAAVLGLSTLDSAFDEAMDVIARTVQLPAFEPGGVEAARTHALQALQDATSYEDTLALEHALRAMVGEHSATQLLGVSSASFGRFSVADVRACFAGLYRPEVSAIVVVGPVSFAESMSAATRHFGSWRGQGPAALERTRAISVIPPTPGIRVHLVHTGESDARVFLAQRAPPALSEDYMSFNLVSIAMGGLFESRMNTALRHGPGASYGVHSRVVGFRDLGLLMIKGDFDFKSTRESIRTMLLELRRLRDRLLSEDEVRVAKVQLAATLRDALHDVGSTAQLAGETFVYGDPNLLTKRQGALTAADAARIHRMSVDYIHPDAADIVVFGNAYALIDDLRELGPVSLYRVTNPD